MGLLRMSAVALAAYGRLQYRGDCTGKTGSTPSGFDAEYIDHLARSFETQTWVYEQAVSVVRNLRLITRSLGEAMSETYFIR